ncbi:MAG: phosphoenolpyruvate carboxylase, partial [Sphingopyxis sp.]
MTMDLRAELGELHKQTQATPLFNPVFQLGLNLSRRLERGDIRLADIAATIEDYGCEALQSRAHRLHDLLAPMGETENVARFRAVVEASAASGDFAAFAARWEAPLQHIVFTGHPTFLLSTIEADAVASAASQSQVGPAMCVINAARAPVTLSGEHAQALSAMARAQDARDTLVDTILSVAAEHWPEQWRELAPMPFRLATWVGYDMDGRTDIGWHTSIAHRLTEKAMRLTRYADALVGAKCANEIAAALRRAGAHSTALAGRFSGPMDDHGALSEAANALTKDGPDRLVSLGPTIAALQALAVDASADDARRLLRIVAAMRADGLGMGWIHFRVNSAQLLNAIRRRIDPENQLDLASGTALARLRALLANVKPLRSNFAALAIESTTAVRQFLAMAQIVHHIDADAPVRMLIAECEEPQTVLAALYFARLFGIEDRVDVSPLFETESAMEHGGRFLEALLREPAYRDYARLRGRVAIQTGFSDAGRFVGQLPAALAIERLHGRLAQAMARNGLTDVAALIFNTHGESSGRGAHGASMEDRLTYPMSRWARTRFHDAGIT